MIHEEICTYELCKLAKEKGFPQDDWSWTGDLYDESGELCFSTNSKSCAAPTQSLLQRWLREEKNIVVVVDWFSTERKYYWSVFDTTKDDMFASFIPPSRSMSRYDTWEQALESGLKYALKKLE